VYERAVELREVGAGIGLVSNASRALDALGLGRAIRSQSLGGVRGGLRNPKSEVLESSELIAVESRSTIDRLRLQGTLNTEQALGSVYRRIGTAAESGKTSIPDTAQRDRGRARDPRSWYLCGSLS
jgi:hypothetical protein